MQVQQLSQVSYHDMPRFQNTRQDLRTNKNTDWGDWINVTVINKLPANGYVARVLARKLFSVSWIDTITC